MLLVLADLHLDHWASTGRDPLAGVGEDVLQETEYCVIAGDLTNKAVKHWSRCLDWLGKRMPKASFAIIPGNHDYYDGRIDREDKLRAAAESAGAIFAQKQVLEIGTRRFLCCTLWTDFNLLGSGARPFSMLDAGRVMNDYRYIRVEGAGYRRLRPEDTAQIHASHRVWLTDELARPWSGETVVVTHHAPHPGAVKTNPAGVDAAYASDLTDLILEFEPDYWIYGHTHRPTSFDLGVTRIRSASIGYPHEVSADSKREGFSLPDGRAPRQGPGLS